MSEQPKMERMLRLLLMLSQGIKYSFQELAIKLNLSERTIRRYIETFENVGFAVEKEQGYLYIKKLEKPFKDLSDLLFFTEEEAFIIRRAIHNIEENNLLKQNLVKKLYSLYDYGKVADTIVKREYTEIVHNLICAINEKKQIILRSYRSANSQIVRDRLVEVFAFTNNFVSVWAYDPGSRTNKLFKTTRIKSIDITDKNYQFEKEHVKNNIDVFRISTKNKIDVILKLNLRAYNLLIEEFPLTEEYIETQDDKNHLFNGWVCNFEGIGRFILGLPNEVEIISPLELQSYVKEKAKNILQIK